jgi:hypothetical protein
LLDADPAEDFSMAANTYIYPTNFELSEIQQLYIGRMREGRIGIDLCPVENSDYAEVRWEQMDNYYGLQQLRGMDGSPTRVQRIGSQVFSYDPGIYGELTTVPEMELTKRAASASSTAPIDIGDLVRQCLNTLEVRRWERIEYNVWTLFITGVLNINVGDATTGTQVGVSDTYPIQTSSTTAWSNTATATPIHDMQTIQQAAVGYSMDLGGGAEAYMNGQQSYYLLNNTNASDFGGRKDMFGATLNNIPQVANYFQAQNLAKPHVYDQGYYATIGNNTTGAFTRFISTGKVLVVGARPGNVPVARYKMTRCAVNGGAPGSYSYVQNWLDGSMGVRELSRGIEVVSGHNGGIAMYYPSAIYTLSA